MKAIEAVLPAVEGKPDAVRGQFSANKEMEMRQKHPHVES